MPTAKPRVYKVPKTVTIKRSKWATPSRTNDAALRTDENFLCCLGFVCEAAGVPRTKTKGVCMPNELVDIRVDGLVGTKSRFSRKAAIINDDSSISDSEREAALTKLFAKSGPCKLRFVP